MKYNIYRETEDGLVSYVGKGYGKSPEEVAAIYIGGGSCNPKSVKKGKTCELLGWPDKAVTWYTSNYFLTKIGLAEL